MSGHFSRLNTVFILRLKWQICYCHFKNLTYKSIFSRDIFARQYLYYLTATVFIVLREDVNSFHTCISSPHSFGGDFHGNNSYCFPSDILHVFWCAPNDCFDLATNTLHRLHTIAPGLGAGGMI